MEICGLKEAIEKLKNLQDWYKKGNMSTTIESSELEALCVVLQSLEELQKESDEYKEAYSDYQELGKEYAKLQDELNEIIKENTELKEKYGFDAYFYENSISKDKIKEKIEELKKNPNNPNQKVIAAQIDASLITCLEELLKGE